MKSKNLNGWQRLWIVISIFLLLFTIYFSYISLPSNNKIEIEWTKSLMNYSLEHDSTLSNFKLEDLGKMYSDMSPEEFIERFNERYVQKHPELKSKIDSINNKYKDMINYSLINYTLKNIGFWLASIILIYIIGFSISWIIVGFKKS